MEKNQFLLFNEITYRIHACEDLDELKRTILSQVKLLIPCTFASVIDVTWDPEAQELRHHSPVCLPPSFAQVEEEWIRQVDQSFTMWLSHAPETVVIRDSDVMAEARFDASSYRHIYSPLHVADSIEMNASYDRVTMARIAFYRTDREPLFSQQDAFFLQALSNHINLAYHRVLGQAARKAPRRRTMEQLVQEYDLTRREEQVLALVFQNLNNEEMLEKLSISRHTLLKHFQNLYRKCGVSSRVDLMKLQG